MFLSEPALRVRQLCLAAALLTWAEGAWAASPQVEGEEFFERHVRPLLASQCADCHSADDPSGGFDVGSRAALLRGGATGPAIEPGDSDRSLLIQAVRQTGDLRMPPDSRLDDEQVAILERWVASGAPWPAERRVADEAAAPAAAGHWAFQPIVRPELPANAEAARRQTPVDDFVLAKLHEAGLQPAPRADRRTLIRRATYDLTGLPPAEDELQAFLSDPAPDAEAFARVVDRLLASPQYGVHWARHWFDVARYSDSKGYVPGAEYRYFVQSTAYRDWVVDAFNGDLPYDRFLFLQIAADEEASADPRSLAAMGFLTLGRRFQGVTHEIIDDRIDVVTRGTMALTVSCARCHDHKYDPISTADYYALYGVFMNCREEQVPLTAASSADAASEDELRRRREHLAKTLAEHKEAAHERVCNRLTDYLLAQLDLQNYPEEGFNQVLRVDDVIPGFVRRWQAYLASAVDNPAFVAWHRFLALPPQDFALRAPEVCRQLAELPAEACNRLVAEEFRTAPQSMREVAERYGRLFKRIDGEWDALRQAAEEARQPAPHGLDDPDAEALRQVTHGASSPCRVPNEAVVNIEYYFDRGTLEPMWIAQSRLDRWLLQSEASPPHAVALFDREQIREPRVFRRGNPALKGEQVPRRFLSVLSPHDSPPFQQGSGRWELARAIIDPGNPLTARVWANRVWMHHFGQGLVLTPSEFGLRAAPPSHPELLDWLASELRSQGWSTKALHRVMMLSATYQQTSYEPGDGAAFAAARQMDPENRLLWRMNPHRLSFEELRDTMLSVTGDLRQDLGGRTADLFPADDSNHRRSLFGLVDRQFLSNAQRMFDFANPDLHTPQRTETSVPQQALFAMNHPFPAARARSLAARLVSAESADSAASADSSASHSEHYVAEIYRRVLQRPPAPAEQRRATAFLEGGPLPAAGSSRPPSIWRYGYGAYAAGTGVVGFAPLPCFTGSAWQGTSSFPAPQLGALQLTAAGGCAGSDVPRVVIRRWVAPRAMEVAIRSEAKHESSAGDGIVCRIVVRGTEELAAAEVHNKSAELVVASCRVAEGDAIDFVADGRLDAEDDEFAWAPVVTERVAGDAPAESWNAKVDFCGPPDKPLNRRELLAQALLLSNELAFID